MQCTPNHLHTYGVLTHLSLMVCNTHQIFGVLTHLSLKVCNTHQIFGLLTHLVTEGLYPHCHTEHLFPRCFCENDMMLYYNYYVMFNNLYNTCTYNYVCKQVHTCPCLPDRTNGRSPVKEKHTYTQKRRQESRGQHPSSFRDWH